MSPCLKALVDQMAAHLFLLNRLRKQDKYFGLYGRAGTGKTKVICDFINEELRPFNTVVVSLSNKAVSNIESMYTNNYIVHNKLDFMTINKFLNKKATFDSKGETVFVSSKWNSSFLKNTDIIIIDEASMIDEETLLELKLKTKSSCRIILVGDRYQCPSPKGGYYNDLFDPNLVPHYELTIPVRYDDNINHVVEYVRKLIDYPIQVNEFLSNLKSLTSQNVFIHNDKKSFINNAIACYKNKESAIVLAYKNDTVSNMAEYIRSNLTQYPEDEYEIGDVLICESSYSSLLNDKFYISCLYRIENIIETCVHITKNHSDSEMLINYDTDTIFINPNECDYLIDGYELDLLDISNNQIKTAFVPRKNDNSLKEYEKAKQYFYNKNKLCDFKIKKYAEDYYKVSNVFHNFNHAFAINVYKSQGSTYDKVFININDILKIKPISISDKYRAIYTAMTRASKEVHLLI